MNLHAAILAGGSGTRFWPASTVRVPKQFLPLTGGAPMLREAADRLLPLVGPERLAVVTAESTADDVRRLLPELPAANLLAEPCGRNTAAACALAARWAHRRDPDAVVVTTPSDHFVSPAEDLRAALAAAATRAAATGRLLTLGLRPTRAATGYGWIRLGAREETIGGFAIHRVEQFVEKPDRARAEAFFAGGAHLWNLGMFAWRADAFLSALLLHLPETAGALADAADGALGEAYARIASVSVDHGVLERHDGVEVIPTAFVWDDLGSFAAVARHIEPDAGGNHASGASLAVGARGCVTWAEPGALVALLGVENLIVVHANGVTLVAPRDRAEEVRRVVGELGPAGLAEFR